MTVCGVILDFFAARALRDPTGPSDEDVARKAIGEALAGHYPPNSPVIAQAKARAVRRIIGGGRRDTAIHDAIAWARCHVPNDDGGAS